MDYWFLVAEYLAIAGELLVQCWAAVAGAAEHVRNICSAGFAVAESLDTAPMRDQVKRGERCMSTADLRMIAAMSHKAKDPRGLIANLRFAGGQWIMRATPLSDQKVKQAWVELVAAGGLDKAKGPEEFLEVIKRSKTVTCQA